MLKYSRCQHLVYTVNSAEDESQLSCAKDGGVINTGATSGALSPDSQRAQDHAEKYYESVRNRRGDVERIAEHTGFSIGVIKAIKDHVFTNEHRFADGRIERFTPDYEQSQAWQRLENGSHTEDDIVFLRHELSELRLMQNGVVYETAHEQANTEFNWQEIVLAKRKE